MYARQLWSKYTETSMKRLQVAYNNAYKFMHHIPRNVSVRPHQVNRYIKSFDTLFRNNLNGFVQQCASLCYFFMRLLQMSEVLYKSSFFHNYSMHLRDGDQLK